MDTSSQSNNDPIADILDITPISHHRAADVVILDEVANNVSTDYEYARGNIINILEKGNEALSDMIQFAQQSQHPRGYEVVATLIKTLSETNKDLLELIKKKKDLETTQEGPTNVQNNLFVGSTNELLKLLKNNGKQ
jgi:hypothetical protein